MAGMTRSSSSASSTAGPGAGLHPAHVEQVGPVVDQLAGPAHQVVEGEGGPLVVEGVGGPVEDAHDQGPVGDVEGPVAERQRGGVHDRDAIAQPPGRRRRRGRRPTGQNSRAASALR